MTELNGREDMLLTKASMEAKAFRNAEKTEVWREGKLVEVRVVKIFDRETVKATND